MQAKKVSSDQLVEIVYKNHRGETSRRIVQPDTFFFGNTEWHPQPQWFMNAYDIGKQDNRTFAISDIQSWTQIAKPEKALENQS